MENNAKVLEYISHHLISDYVKKLIEVNMDKLVLFTSFPITGAANISDPQYFIKILNPEILKDLVSKDLN